jgi:hypothetical protein
VNFMQTRPVRVSRRQALLMTGAGLTALMVGGGVVPTARAAVADAWMPERLSLMVQVSSVAGRPAAVADLVAAMAHIRAQHRGAGAGLVQNLVLQDLTSTAPGSELAVDVLDAIAPYLPGGATPAFDNLFVGTTIEPGPPAGASEWSPYVEGVLDASLRAAYVHTSAGLARAFVDRYPFVVHHWYLTWEAFLPPMMYADGFPGQRADPSRIRAAYVELVGEVTAALNAVRGGRAFVWSPAIDRPLVQVRVDGQEQATRTNLTSFFQELVARMQQSTSYPRALWLEPQDGLSRPSLMVGGAHNNTVETRIEWFRFLDVLDLGVAALELNAELFTAPSDPDAGNTTAVRARLQAYEGAGIPLGTCFDLDGWRRAVDAAHH